MVTTPNGLRALSITGMCMKLGCLIWVDPSSIGSKVAQICKFLDIAFSTAPVREHPVQWLMRVPMSVLLTTPTAAPASSRTMIGRNFPGARTLGPRVSTARIGGPW